jgi:hypothetical protein
MAIPVGPSPHLGTRSTLVSPAGSGGLRVRLVRADVEEAGPFVVVHEGRFAIILLAELYGSDGVALKRFALKLRKDEVVKGATSSWQQPSNAELDRGWQLEREELLRVHSPHVVPAFAVPPALTRSLPVFFCRRIDTYFHPVCPETGSHLSVCQDDSVLQAAGLPAYGLDTVRYLRGVAADGRAPQAFFRIGGPREATATARVENLAGLIRSWSRVNEGEQSLPGLPCQECEHRSECYAESPDRVLAEQYLHPVSFYDVDSLALELATTDFETAAVWLGGERQGADPGYGWIHGFDRKRRVLEVLRLKLAAFADVCRGVDAVHAAGRPHLGVSPANIVVFEGAGNDAMPANWRLRFALTDLGGAEPVQVPGGVDGETLWKPGREVSEDGVSRLFLAPLLRSLEGGSVTMSVTTNLVVGDDGRSRCLMDVHRAGVPSFAMPGDLVLIEPVDGGPCAGARVDGVDARGLKATIVSGRAIPADGDDDEVGAQPLWAGTTFDARLSFVRRSGPSADLYGLGMILLRLLLVHDEQTFPEVASAAERCIQALTTKLAVDDTMSLSDRWQELLGSDIGEGRFACWHVMHQRRDRRQIFDGELREEVIIPKPIWRALLDLAGRLLLASPLSRVEEGGGAEAPVAAVLKDLWILERQLHVELFEREARDECVVALCAQRRLGLMAGLPEVSVAQATIAHDAGPPDLVAQERAAHNQPATNARGFVLSIARVGESQIERYHFTQDRVTIGRRAGENLLVLSDSMVSSKHAVIERVDGDYVMFDCGSTNGTEVDGIRLPVEVAHPLEDGMTIYIRPFMLSFRQGEAGPDSAEVVEVSGADEVYQKLCSVYATSASRGGLDLHAEMTTAIDGLVDTLGERAMLGILDAILAEHSNLLSPADGSKVASSVAEPIASPEDAALARSALKSLRQLARGLTDSSELNSAAEIQEFASRVHRFVDVSSRWIEGMLEWRTVFSKQLDLRVTQTGAVRPPLRTAAEVCEELLTPTGSHDGAATSEYFLSRFYDDILAILEGLMEGGQRLRAAVREQLDPGRLVAEAGREAKLRILVQAAAGSALWQLYTKTFEAVTTGGEHEAELQRLLGLAVERRQHRS